MVDKSLYTLHAFSFTLFCSFPLLFVLPFGIRTQRENNRKEKKYIQTKIKRGHKKFYFDIECDLQTTLDVNTLVLMKENMT